MGLANFCNRREFMKDQQVHYIHGEDGVTLTPCSAHRKLLDLNETVLRRGFDFLSTVSLSADFSVFIFAIS